MRLLILLLLLCVIFLTAHLQVAHGESNAPMQMARLRKKGSRNDGSCTDESLRKIMHEGVMSGGISCALPYAYRDSSRVREFLQQARGVEQSRAISDDLTESKRAVHRAVTNAFEGSYGVLCAECAFSYIIHTHEYCTHTRNDITCLVYKDA